MTAEEKSKWKLVDNSIGRNFPDSGDNIYYKDIILEYNGSILDVNDGNTIQKIEIPVINSENNSILFKLIGRRSEENTGVYYFSLDLEGNLPEKVTCYNTSDEATIKRAPKKDTSYIISISPIN